VETLRRVFDEHHALRALVLAHIGRQLVEISSLVACTRLTPTASVSRGGC